MKLVILLFLQFVNAKLHLVLNTYDPIHIVNCLKYGTNGNNCNRVHEAMWLKLSGQSYGGPQNPPHPESNFYSNVLAKTDDLWVNDYPEFIGHHCWTNHSICNVTDAIWKTGRKNWSYKEVLSDPFIENKDFIKDLFLYKPLISTVPKGHLRLKSECDDTMSELPIRDCIGPSNSASKVQNGKYNFTDLVNFTDYSQDGEKPGDLRYPEDIVCCQTSHKDYLTKITFKNADKNLIGVNIDSKGRIFIDKPDNYGIHYVINSFYPAEYIKFMIQAKENFYNKMVRLMLDDYPRVFSITCGKDDFLMLRKNGETNGIGNQNGISCDDDFKFFSGNELYFHKSGEKEIYRLGFGKDLGEIENFNDSDNYEIKKVNFTGGNVEFILCAQVQSKEHFTEIAPINLFGCLVKNGKNYRVSLYEVELHTGNWNLVNSRILFDSIDTEKLENLEIRADKTSEIVTFFILLKNGKQLIHDMVYPKNMTQKFYEICGDENDWSVAVLATYVKNQV